MDEGSNYYDDEQQMTLDTFKWDGQKFVADEFRACHVSQLIFGPYMIRFSNGPLRIYFCGMDEEMQRELYDLNKMVWSMSSFFEHVRHHFTYHDVPHRDPFQDELWERINKKFVQIAKKPKSKKHKRKVKEASKKLDSQFD